jgi:hypothetical protein
MGEECDLCRFFVLSRLAGRMGTMFNLTAPFDVTSNRSDGK